MKSAVFERQQGQISTALETLGTALKKYPKFAKLYMIQGQIHQFQGNLPAARASFAAGIKAVPKDVTLWILASRLEEADGKSIKARALLDKARLANPGSDVLWAEAVGVEERSGGTAQAKTVLARGEHSVADVHVAVVSNIFVQGYKNALPPAYYGPWLSGPSHVRHANLDQQMLFAKPRMTHLSYVRLLGCFGPSARLRKPVSGSSVRSRQIRTSGTFGAGG